MVNNKRSYELKGKFLDDLRDNAFSRTNGEDAVEYIEYFLKIVDLINLPNVNYERLRLSVFPISLVENASKWFDEFKGSITSWVDLTESFFGKYYPPSRTGRITVTKAIRDPSNSTFENNFLDNEEHENKDKHGLFDNQKWPDSKIRRFEMIKYSFGKDEEYVAIKEHEYDDLTSTNEDACRTYQEIFHRMDKGWMDLAVKEIDEVGEVSII
ncbi:hypothetical protein Tco_0748437 [Tanacetum coccineum]|uniref:Retrotransposon gag domain-containing protein n=1 Tax=Tanacetum coccineum TaxID=301880 RepID=A0ABQ4YWT9_9ASTR